MQQSIYELHDILSKSVLQLGCHKHCICTDILANVIMLKSVERYGIAKYRSQIKQI